MAKPPRFQRRRPGSGGGFVDSVRGAMEQIQHELDAAAKAGREGTNTLRREVEEARRSVQEAAKRSPAAAAEMARQQARQAQQQLKKTLKAKLAGALQAREQKPVPAAPPPPSTPPPSSAGSLDLMSAGDAARATAAASSAARPSDEAAYEANVDYLESVRHLIRRPATVRQAIILQEILGRPKSLRS